MNMRNDNHPMIQALKGRLKPKDETPLPQFNSPRQFEIQHHEIPGLPGKRVGDHISVHLEGHVHSQSNDGKAIMHVAAVKPDSSEMTKKENPESKIVTTQESHVP